MFNYNELQSLIEKWQNILRLRDWDIKLELVNKEWHKTGDVKIDLQDKKAVVLINNFNPKQTNIEELIIHELLHVKLYGMDEMLEDLLHCLYGEGEKNPMLAYAYGQYMTLLEQTVEDLAKGYKDLGAEDKAISFGRLKKQIDDELNNKL